MVAAQTLPQNKIQGPGFSAFYKKLKIKPY